MNELALFAGAGGGILGGHLLGWRTVCAVEWEPYPASVLAARQNDGLLPAFPIWDDVRTFDGRPWRGIVDVVSGGFPCQDISAAGKGAGIDGERSGMWREMARIVGEVRPRFVFVENSPLLVGRGLARVLGDLAEMGFDARWGVLGAADVGAPHRRERCWVVAHAESERCGEAREFRHHEPEERATGCSEVVCDTTSSGSQKRTGEALGRQKKDTESERSNSEMADTCCLDEQGQFASGADSQEWCGSIIGSSRSCGNGKRWWATEPDVGRVAHGVAARVDRLKAIGNGQVPQCAAQAWRILTANAQDKPPAESGSA